MQTNNQNIQQTAAKSVKNSLKGIQSINEQQQSKQILRSSLSQPIYSPKMHSNSIHTSMQKNYNITGSTNIRPLDNPSFRAQISYPETYLSQTQHGLQGSIVQKLAQSEPKHSNFESILSQYRKNQVRQFTLGNEFETQTAHFIQKQSTQSNNGIIFSQEQLTGCLNNVNNRSDSQNSQQGNAKSLNTQSTNEDIRQIISEEVRLILNKEVAQVMSELQQQIKTLEERLESSEEKIELNERLFRLKGEQIENRQLNEISVSIKQDVDKTLQNVMALQQHESERTLHFINKLQMFEKQFSTQEETYLAFTNHIDSLCKSSFQQQNALIDKTLKLATQNASQIDNYFEKYNEFNAQFTDLNDRIKLLQQNITLHKDETSESLKQYENSLEQLTKVQNSITTDLKQNITPSINALEDDMLKILQNYKELSDNIHIVKYLDEEVILLKHKIKIILQKVNINDHLQVSNASLISFANFKS